MSKYIEEEITLAEFAERFIGVNDYSKPGIYDVDDLGIEVLTLNDTNQEVYRTIQSFLVKDAVSEFYTDGKIKVTANHRFIENGTTIFAKDHSDFTKVRGEMNVVDIEVDDLHSYLANGRLNHNTTSGGKALAFHSSVRLRLKNMGTIKIKVRGKDRIVGIKVRAQVIKNRMGPPLRSSDFDIFFERGIDNYGSWLEVMKDNDLVKQAGAWYAYVDIETGEEIKFQSKDWAEILNTRSEVRDQIYRRICELTILQYKNNSVDPDEVTVSDDLPGELD